jgi:hypothetical protein
MTNDHIIISTQDLYELMVDREEIDLTGNSLMCTFIFMMERGCISELTRPYTTTYAAGPLADREVTFFFIIFFLKILFLLLTFFNV